MPTLNSDGSASDTQAKINSAASGDTVLLPSSGSYTWSSSVSIPNTKAITLDLNGRTITLSGASGSFSIDPPSSGTDINRVTNGNVVRGNGYNAYSGPFQIGGTRTGAGVRVDNIGFTGSNVIIEASGEGKSLMDHCTATGLGGAQEWMHITAWGNSDTAGWTNDSGDTLAGSDRLFYIEDCTFTTTHGQANNSWIQGYYGCRVCIRYNTFNYTCVDMHGTPGNIGARWWEFYENTFNVQSGDNSGPAFNMRAGSGIIYNNYAAGTGSAPDIKLGEEDNNSYPENYQIGRGLNETSDPARVYSNWTTPSLDDCDGQNGCWGQGFVQLNRDVYYSARPSYTPYTYPHPLQGGGGGGEPGTGGHGPGHKRGILRRM